MKTGFLNTKDFWAGIMFIGIGVAAMVISRDYRMGSALHMGPGYFPRMCGGILVGFGICIMAVGLRKSKGFKERLSLRGFIMIPASFILFGILMKWAGFIPAVMALVFVSAASGREFKFVEVSLLCFVLTAVSVALFVWGLGLPYPLIRGF